MVVKLTTNIGQGEATVSWLPVSVIEVDPEYQRGLNKERVGVIARNFRWAAFGVLTVSYRDGSYWVVDGQHRLVAAKRVGARTVPCIILPSTTAADEAGLFSDMNKVRGPLRATDVFRAKVTAKDADALAIVDACKSRGIAVSTKGTHHLRSISSVATLEWIYKRGGTDLLLQVLDIILDSCPSDPEPWRGDMMKGLATLLHVYNGEFDRNRLVRRFAETPHATLRNKVAYLKTISGGTLYLPNVWARVLTDFLYNQRLSKGRLDVSRLDKIRWAEASPNRGGA